jgi:hypothetical protein
MPCLRERAVKVGQQVPERLRRIQVGRLENTFKQGLEERADTPRRRHAQERLQSPSVEREVFDRERRPQRLDRRRALYEATRSGLVQRLGCVSEGVEVRSPDGRASPPHVRIGRVVRERRHRQRRKRTADLTTELRGRLEPVQIIERGPERRSAARAEQHSPPHHKVTRRAAEGG